MPLSLHTSKLNCVRSFALTVSLSLAANSTIGAQASQTPSRFVGVTAGINQGQLTDDRSGAATSLLTGYMVGVLMRFPLGGSLFVQPEAYYTQKGTEITDPTGKLQSRFGFFEVPVLLRYEIGTNGRGRPFVYAGPFGAYRSSCDFSYTGGGATGSASCARVFQAVGSSPGELASGDFGIVGGGGYTTVVGANEVSIGARVSQGFIPVSSSSTEKHRVYSFLMSYDLPLGR